MKRGHSTDTLPDLEREVVPREWRKVKRGSPVPIGQVYDFAVHCSRPTSKGFDNRPGSAPSFGEPEMLPEWPGAFARSADDVQRGRLALDCRFGSHEQALEATFVLAPGGI